MRKLEQGRRYSDRRLLAAESPVDWAGFISGTVSPKVDVNVVMDDSTARVIYIGTGVLSLALLGSALLRS